MRNLIMELLPEEITRDILSRLPVDSLLLCKRMCRAWEALIKDPGFHDEWMNRWVDPVNKLGTIVCVSSNGSSQLKFGAYSDDGAGFELRNTPADHHPPRSFKGSDSWNIVGSCNGLICVTTGLEREGRWFYRNKFSMYVGNPLTREYVRLPRIKPKTELCCMCMSVGFGYCPTTKEYKSVVIYDWHVEVYTLGSGRWRRRSTRTSFLESSWSPRDCSGPAGVLANGALYFYRYVVDDIVSFKRKVDHIVSFDLASEKFKVVRSPPHHQLPASIEFQGLMLGVLGGNLCLFKWTRLLGVCDVWVMENEESWTKKFSKPGYSLEEIIIKDDNSPNVWGWEYMFSYVKSFVSVKDLGEKDTILM